MTSKSLGPAEVHAIGQAAMDNALSLMADAKALLPIGRPQSAYAIGVIAMEEAAKFNLCRLMLQDWTGSVTVVELNKLLEPRGAHVQRFRDFLLYLRALAPFSWPLSDDELLQIAKNDTRARERCLYVEVAPDGAPKVPAQVNPAQATTWVTGMADLFVQLASAWRADLDESLGAVT